MIAPARVNGHQVPTTPFRLILHACPRSSPVHQSHQPLRARRATRGPAAFSTNRHEGVGPRPRDFAPEATASGSCGWPGQSARISGTLRVGLPDKGIIVRQQAEGRSGYSGPVQRRYCATFQVEVTSPNWGKPAPITRDAEIAITLQIPGTNIWPVSQRPLVIHSMPLQPARHVEPVPSSGHQSTPSANKS